MEIEKLSDNKIRITFNNLYLEKNNINAHSFMSNSIESQNLFLNILDEAEREIGFITDNYKLSVESIALSDGSYIITVTRIGDENQKSNRVQVHRKNISQNNSKSIYKFYNFDDFCNFQNFLNILQIDINFDIQLYQYKNLLFLILENCDDSISAIINEFAVIIPASDLLIDKIIETGKLVNINLLHK